MQSINFEVGNYKEYALNGDENNTIKIDVSDIGLIKRLRKAMEEIDEYQKQFEGKEEADENLVSELDEKAREIINKAFDSDVCTKAFGNKNCMSVASNGLPNMVNFLNAFIPVIQNDFQSEIEKEQKTLEEKTAKYIEPVVKNSAPEIDVSALSQEQKKALIEELSK